MTTNTICKSKKNKQGLHTCQFLHHNERTAQIFLPHSSPVTGRKSEYCGKKIFDHQKSRGQFSPPIQREFISVSKPLAIRQLYIDDRILAFATDDIMVCYLDLREIVFELLDVVNQICR